MARGPICGETNPSHIRTPGPLGCNDSADRNNPIIDLVRPFPLLPQGATLWWKKDGESNSVTALKATRSLAESATKVRKPSAAIIKKLSAEINAVRKLNQKYEKEKKQKDETLRKKKEKVLKDIVQAYKVGLKYVTGLEFDNRQGSNFADTRGTFVIAYDDILVHPGFVASVIMHESSHAQRNAELAAAGVDRNQFGLIAEEAWVTMIEFEGYQLEIDYAAKTGITTKEIDAAKRGREGYLAEYERMRGETARTDLENDLDQYRANFIQKQKKLQQQKKKR